MWLTQASADPNVALLQYGAVGAVAVLAIGGIAYLFRLLIRVYQEAVARADRHEEEVRRLNADIRDDVVPALTRSTEALSEAMQTIQAMRRR